MEKVHAEKMMRESFLRIGGPWWCDTDEKAGNRPPLKKGSEMGRNSRGVLRKRAKILFEIA